MAIKFNLTNRELIDIALDFETKIQLGLQHKDQELKCLPAYIPFSSDIKDGQVYVLDLGGSNLRAAVVSFANGKAHFLKGPIKIAMPWERNKNFPKEQYLSIQSNLLASLSLPIECPIGYCFSYPTESIPNRDAKLINWTKGIKIPETEGFYVGKMLLQYLHSNKKEVKCKRISVINDTIASLFAGLIEPEDDLSIGLIVGTGTNMSTFIDNKYISTLSNELDWRGLLPVNLESGNFSPPHLTDWDDIVDEYSENSGKHRFEKAVSGMYLGRLFKTVFPESNFNQNDGAEGLVRLLNKPNNVEKKHILVAQKIIDRSSKLIAASLAGLIKLLLDQSSQKNIRIVAEGGLFWSQINGRLYYRDKTKLTLESLLNDLGLSNIEIKFLKIEEANLLGSALAAIV